MVQLISMSDCIRYKLIKKHTLFDLIGDRGSKMVLYWADGRSPSMKNIRWKVVSIHLKCAQQIFGIQEDPSYFSLTL
jgi:hypothetical protein